MTKLQATVKRCGHNREVESVRMVEAEPHIMLHIGGSGEPQSGVDANEMLTELMRLGHTFEVLTEYRDVSVLDF